MFGIGMQELAVILLIALVVFGPKRLPELARSLGKGLGEFRRASTDLRQSLVDAAEEPRESTGPAAPEAPRGPSAPDPGETRTGPPGDPDPSTESEPGRG
ncbi:MAG: twin-arginine translocase TatA/TatE family subunit [Myxococcota bacterium]